MLAGVSGLAVLAALPFLAESSALSAPVSDATWLATPATADWNTAGNWSPATVPVGTATFGASTQTTIGFSGDNGYRHHHLHRRRADLHVQSWRQYAERERIGLHADRSAERQCGRGRAPRLPEFELRRVRGHHQQWRHRPVPRFEQSAFCADHHERRGRNGFFRVVGRGRPRPAQRGVDRGLGLLLSRREQAGDRGGHQRHRHRLGRHQRLRDGHAMRGRRRDGRVARL